MNDADFLAGAPVVSSTNEPLGTVEHVSAGTMTIRDGQRAFDIPLELIDRQRSSPERVILSGRIEAPGTLVEVVSEELAVSTREVERGRVRIEKTVEQVPYHEDVELHTDVMSIERIPGGQEYDIMPQQRQDGETLIIPVVEEFLVLTTRYRVMEEVHVTKRREVRTETVEDELRREVVTVYEEDTEGNSLG